jgi:PucR family transcriptional regulator, purine catabolism regulatory protein
MAVTVEQILRLGALSQARVLAGTQGLDRTVSSVTVGEVPDIAEWLSGGEIVLSTMFALTNDTDRQRDFCRRIMAAGAAALFVKPKRFVGAFPLDILEIAEKRNFPIVEVPQEIRWTRIMQETMEVLINRQASLLEKSQEIHRKLLEVVIQGGGWGEVATSAARLIDKPVLVLDVSLEPLGVSAEFPWPESELHRLLDKPSVRAEFDRLARFPSKVLHLVQEGVPPLFAVPIVVSHSCLGYVGTITERHELEEMEQVALEHAATVAAVEMAREQVRFETEVRLKGDFVDDLIGGRFSSEDSLLRRASFLGCDLSRGVTVVVADVDEFEKTMAVRKLNENEVQRLKARFFNRSTRLVAEVEPSSLVSLKSDRVIIFLSDPAARDDRVLEKVTDRLHALGREVADLSVSIGVSRHTSDLAGLRKAFEEALAALKVGRKLQGLGSTMHFESVGSYKLLLSIWEHDPEELRSLYTETVDAVDRYDKQNDSHLVHTLVTYLNNDENLSQTAKDLYAHRHTIRYRLQKIADITGLSVFRSEDKERLSLGLKARSLLNN